GAVSRQLFASVLPRWPLSEIPISSITNGIHVPTWIDSHAEKLWDHAGTSPSAGIADPSALPSLSDPELWTIRSSARAGLIGFVRTRVARQLADSGAPEAEVRSRSRDLFDPNALTIGMARRFATYKRPNLLLTDPDRLARLLADRARP